MYKLYYTPFSSNSGTAVVVELPWIHADDFKKGIVSIVTNAGGSAVFNSMDELEKYLGNLEMAANNVQEMKSEGTMQANYDAQGNANHYKGYLVGEGIDLQWLETQQLKPYWRANPKAFYHAVMLMADRYQSRLGLKDDETQEIVKFCWYTKFATAFAKNGYKPIKVADVDVILGVVEPPYLDTEILRKVAKNAYNGSQYKLSIPEVSRMSELAEG